MSSQHQELLCVSQKLGKFATPIPDIFVHQLSGTAQKDSPLSQVAKGCGHPVAVIHITDEKK